MSDTADLLRALLARGIASGAMLGRDLKVSQPTLSRVINGLGEQIIRIGGGRSTRYGLRRELARIGSSWPVFTINEKGEPLLFGRLEALARDQYWFASPLAQYSQVSDGLPFFLQDSWPQGFIGRTVSKRFPELGLPERINDWTDSHVLTYLTQRGDDSIGNILIGDESLQRYLKRFQASPDYVEHQDRSNRYPLLALAAISGAPPGSSAGGEHPKFTTAVRSKDGVRHVLVKFSPARTDRVSQRWSDLLVAEHLASRSLGSIGVSAAATDLMVAGNRMFLEVERFDRVGLRGRVGVASLATIADHYLGKRDHWIGAADSLKSMGKISAQDAETVRRAATFGRLIGNSDMHFGNLSFFMSPGNPLALAPSYDMLPMMYAPVAGDELPDREFDAPLPSADTLDIWKSMAGAAEHYWREVASHELISPEFGACASKIAENIELARASLPY